MKLRGHQNSGGGGLWDLLKQFTGCGQGSRERGLMGIVKSAASGARQQQQRNGVED